MAIDVKLYLDAVTNSEAFTPAEIERDATRIAAACDTSFTSTIAALVSTAPARMAAQHYREARKSPPRMEGEAVEVLYAGEKVRGVAVAIFRDSVTVATNFGERAFPIERVRGLKFFVPR